MTDDPFTGGPVYTMSARRLGCLDLATDVLLFLVTEDVKHVFASSTMGAGDLWLNRFTDSRVCVSWSDIPVWWF